MVKVNQLKAFNSYKSTIRVTAISKDTGYNGRGSTTGDSGEIIAGLRIVRIRILLQLAPDMHGRESNSETPPGINMSRLYLGQSSLPIITMPVKKHDFGSKIWNQFTAVFGVPTLVALAISSHRGVNTKISTNLHVCLCESDWKTKQPCPRTYNCSYEKGVLL